MFQPCALACSSNPTACYIGRLHSNAQEQWLCEIQGPQARRNSLTRMWGDCWTIIAQLWFLVELAGSPSSYIAMSALVIAYDQG